MSRNKTSALPPEIPKDILKLLIAAVTFCQLALSPVS